MKQIGNYKLIDKLGEGGMGTVFLGEEMSSGNKAAIKVIRADVSSKGSVAARFRQEINVSKQFAHPFVIKILDGGLLPGNKSMYLAMEYLPGESLGTAMANRDIPSDEAWNILSHMAEALSYIHQRGVIHRDIKPDNILLASPDRTVLLDFGLALMDDQTRLSATSDRPGTWGTMAPEQMRGKPLDGRSDVYSLGVTIFWSLVKKSPYTRHDIVRIYNGTDLVPPNLLKIHKSIHPTLAEVIMKCMSFNPEDRFQSANELHLVLQKGPDAYPKGFFIKEGQQGGRSSSVSKSSSSGRSKRRASQDGRISAVTGTSKLSGSNRSSVNSTYTSSRKIRSAGAFLFLFVLVLAGYLTYGASENVGPISFRSTVSVITPTSASLEIGNDSGGISHVHLWEENSADKKVVFFNQLELKGSPLLEAVFKDLLPGKKYQYQLWGKNEQSSLRKSFRTSKLIEAATILDVTATSVKLNLKVNYTGATLVKVEAYPVSGSKNQIEAFAKVSMSMDLVKHKRSQIYFKGLKALSEYRLEVSINTRISSSALSSNETLFVTTKEPVQKQIYRILESEEDKAPLGEIFPGVGRSLGQGVSATSAIGRIGNRIVFSGNNCGLYLYDLLERKLVKRVSTPGKSNLAIRINGGRIYCLESPFSKGGALPESKLNDKTLQVKAYDSDSLTLASTVNIPSHCSKYFLWVGQEKVVVNGNAGLGNLLCYSLTDGKQLWETAELVEGAFSLNSKGILWIKGNKRFVYGYELETGKLKFSLPIEASLSDHPVEVNGMIAAFLLNGDIKVFDSQSGKTIRTLKAGNPVKCALVKGTSLYCVGSAIDSQNVLGTGRTPGRLFAYDFSDTTSIKESFTLDITNSRSSRGNIRIFDDYLYYSTPMLGVNCVDIRNGNFLYTHKAIMIAQFHLYPDQSGFFYCHIGNMFKYVQDR